MNEIKHDDKWLSENAPMVEYQGHDMIDGECVEYAKAYLEHMTRVRVTADESPEEGDNVVGLDWLDDMWKPSGIYSRRGDNWCRLYWADDWEWPDSRYAPDGWQPILRFGGGV